MNKTALVTGSSRGIGATTAIILAKKGYDVAIHYKSSLEKAQYVKTEVETLGQKAYLFQADVSKTEDIKKMFEQYTDEIGTLDLLVNNAGFDKAKLIEEYTFEEMKYVINVVLFSKIVTTKLALPLLKKSDDPVIINIASRMWKEKTIETIGAYGPAMAGVMKWTQSCALEFAKYKIRVNCVAPGLTYTDLTKTMLAEDEFSFAATANPRGRVTTPQDIANVVALIASKEADYINGEIIGVNGGSNLG